jgi:glyoxylase-like metal-dependent hydrolase (beta-lactamase superfamily II)
MKIKSFVCNELAVNAYVLYDDSPDCMIVDPGYIRAQHFDEMKAFIGDRKLKPACIVNTHGHFDHIAGNLLVSRAYGCPVFMHREDLFLVEHASELSTIFGFTIEKPPDPDRMVEDNESIGFGHSSVQAIHVPGHSPGSICLYSARDNILISGDVLFAGGIGRTDLMQGNHDELIRGINNKLMVLPRETEVYPGHGPATTIGQEFDTNPFLN